MKLFTVIVSYNRLDLLRETIASYQATLTLPSKLLIIDNGSDKETRLWLIRSGLPLRLLPENRYPGAACNLAFAEAPKDTTHLHRSDNDMRYLSGWCAEVEQRFAVGPKLGQLGLRTEAEELACETNVGGTSVIDKRLWDQGLRYDERPWQELGSVTEDYYLSQEIERRGWRWERVRRSCVVHTASGDRADPYYQHSYGIRGI